MNLPPAPDLDISNLAQKLDPTGEATVAETENGQQQLDHPTDLNLIFLVGFDKTEIQVGYSHEE